MESAARLRRRIELAEELRSVTGTMKSLAAVSVSQYERCARALREYGRGVELGLQILLRRHPAALAEPSVTADADTLLVVLGSARGLCGPINGVIADHARTVVDELSARGDASCDVVASGARVAMELEERRLAPQMVLDAPGSADAIGPLVEHLLVWLDAWRAPAGPFRVLVVHPQPQEGGRSYEPTTLDLLPLDPSRLHALATAPWPTRMLPRWRGPWPEVYAGLTRQLLFVDLHRAFAETQVCINRARLVAMQGAEDTIADRLEVLSTRYHRQRQAAITGELLDVVSGFEAAGGLDLR